MEWIAADLVLNISEQVSAKELVTVEGVGSQAGTTRVCSEEARRKQGSVDSRKFSSGCFLGSRAELGRRESARADAKLAGRSGRFIQSAQLHLRPTGAQGEPRDRSVHGRCVEHHAVEPLHLRRVECAGGTERHEQGRD